MAPDTVASFVSCARYTVTKRYIGVDDASRRAVESLTHNEIGAEIGAKLKSDVVKKPQIM